MAVRASTGPGRSAARKPWMASPTFPACSGFASSGFRPPSRSTFTIRAFPASGSTEGLSRSAGRSTPG